MAKGQVTEQDLASGMKGLSGFGALSGGRRDSPFRDSRSEPPKESPPKEIDVRPNAETKLPTVERPPQVSVPPEPPVVRREAPERLAKPKAKQPQRKADVFSERVTIQMSPDMRDQVDELARQLQRSKTSKDERITANTVMRVAIQQFIETFKLERGEIVNNEEELLASALRRKK
jgi:predicted transcriptional regulator